MADLKQLKEQYKEELLNNVLPFGSNILKTKNAVVTLLAWTELEKCSIQTNLSGYRAEKSGCFPCYITSWRKIKNG